MAQSISEASYAAARGSSGMVYLMYHELERRGLPTMQQEEGYLRYIVTEIEFRHQIGFLSKAGFRGVSVSGALNSGYVKDIAITFDDGCETDLTVAAPMLKAVNFRATFFIVVGAVGAKGRMTAAQLRELQRLGFELGCHSMSHPHLTELNQHELRHEIVDAKAELEQIIGAPVHHFSCPGGRWNRTIAALAKQAGYLSVSTSRIGVNRAGSDRYGLARVGVMRWTTPGGFRAICQGQGLWRPRMRFLVLAGAKKILGNSLYDRVRSGMLDGKRSPVLLPTVSRTDERTGT